MKKNYHIAVLLTAGGLMLASLSAEAAVLYKERGHISPGMAFWPVGNSIGKGRLKLYPEIALGLVYDDNIYYDETDAESDLIGHLIPRVIIDYSLEERGSIKLGYDGDFAFYSEFSDNNWDRHNVGFQLDYNAPSGLFLDIDDSFVDTSDPFGSREEYSLGEQKDRWHNIFGTTLGYNHDDRLKLAGFFYYNKQEYDNTEVDYSQNFDEKELGIGLEKRISQKTWGFARYLHGARDYNTPSPDGTQNDSNDADYSHDWVYLGLTWDATSRITGELSFGYEWREYDNPVDPAGTPYEDENTWIAATKIDYSLKPGRTDLRFNLEKGINQRGGNTSESFDWINFDMFFIHRFSHWYRLLFNFGIGNNDYNYGRNDDDYRAGIGLEYLMHRRVTLAVGYNYERRDSNQTGASFTNNRLIGTLTVRY